MKTGLESNDNSLNLIKILYFPIQLPNFLISFMGMIFFILLMTFGAYIRLPLPFTPVPITLQTLFAFLAGAFLGSIWGTGSMLLYVLLGAFGLPIFAGANFGITYLLGPTGGYIFGFIFAALMTGYLIGSKTNISKKSLFLIFLFANTIIYLFGILQLRLWMGNRLLETLQMGLIPFIPGDTIKIFLGIYVFKFFNNFHLEDSNI